MTSALSTKPWLGQSLLLDAIGACFQATCHEADANMFHGGRVEEIRQGGVQTDHTPMVPHSPVAKGDVVVSPKNKEWYRSALCSLVTDGVHASKYV